MSKCCTKYYKVTKIKLTTKKAVCFFDLHHLLLRQLVLLLLNAKPFTSNLSY